MKNLFYDKKLNNVKEKNLVDALILDFIYIWKNPAFVDIQNPKDYITQEFSKLKEGTSNYDKWLYLVEKLLMRLANAYYRDYMKYTLENLERQRDNMSSDIRHMLLCDINNACFSICGDSIIMSTIKMWENTEVENTKFIKKIINIRKKAYSELEEMINKENINKEFLYDITFEGIFDIKGFSHKDMFFDLFLLCFITQINEIQEEEERKLTPDDLKSLAFENMENLAENFFIYNIDEITDCFCSYLAKIKYE